MTDDDRELLKVIGDFLEQGKTVAAALNYLRYA